MSVRPVAHAWSPSLLHGTSLPQPCVLDTRNSALMGMALKASCGAARAPRLVTRRLHMES